MTSDIIIRHPSTADAQACSLVEQACFPPEEAASLQSIQTRIAIFSQGFLVAERGGQIIGQVNSGATSKDDITDEAFKQLIGHDPAGKNMVVFSLSVLPEYQENGVASRLMREFLALAQAQKREAVLLLCKAGLVPFYERFGFVSRGVSACTHGGAQWLEMYCPVTG